MTAGQGKLLRRALGKSDVSGFEALFLAGAQARGASVIMVGAVLNQLPAFGRYSFPKSHAAAFAVLVYQSAWLKVYHPVAFYCALLNNQPMGFWSPAVIVHDARHHGIAIRSVDINRSSEHCTLEDGTTRLGLNYIHRLGEQGAAHIVAAWTNGDFRDLTDFCRGVNLPQALVETLILVGAFDLLHLSRCDLLWALV